MKDKDEVTRLNLKGFFSYISTVISWTVFALLLVIGVLLIYYYISLQLYKTKGEKYEPLFSIYTIISPSMEPNIKVMDAVVNLKVNNPDKIEVNDVITFTSTWKVNYGMTVTHRIVATQILDDGSRCFITRGDNNPGNDEGCVKESNVIGVVKAVIPGLGNLQRFIASGVGWLTIIIIPALYILIKDILKIFRMVKMDDDKKDDQEEKNDNKKNKDKQTSEKIEDNSNEQIIENDEKVDEKNKEEKEDMVAEQISENVEVEKNDDEQINKEREDNKNKGNVKKGKNKKNW